MTSISDAAQKIIDGEVVAFATETVWGLGASAYDDTACRKIYALKGRPSNNPLIVHVSDLEMAQKLVKFNEAAHKLAALIPGPLTLVLPQKPNNKIAPVVSAGLDSLAVRIPASHTLCALIQESGVPIAAPSANKSNYISSTTEEHVRMQFAQELVDEEMSVLAAKDDEICYGLESTIIDCMDDTKLTILRSGFVLPQALQAITGLPVEFVDKAEKIIAPGMLNKHYAPAAPLFLNRTVFQEGEVVLSFGKCSHPNKVELSSSGNLLECAANLYSALHAADQLVKNNDALKSIAVMPIPHQQIGFAINDRLIRAASK